MIIKEKLQKLFPQINVISIKTGEDLSKTKVEYACSFHGQRKTESLSKLRLKKSCCTKCSNLLNRGHAFNLDGKPNEAKKIQELVKMFDGKFDYSQFGATDTITPSTIICKKHGAFSMSVTDHVMLKGQHGCPSCLEEAEGKSVMTVAMESTSPQKTEEQVVIAKATSTIESERKVQNPIKERVVSADWLEKAKSMFASVAR